MAPGGAAACESVVSRGALTEPGGLRAACSVPGLRLHLAEPDAAPSWIAGLRAVNRLLHRSVHLAQEIHFCPWLAGSSLSLRHPRPVVYFLPRLASYYR